MRAVPAGLMLAAVIAIGWVRPRVAERFHKLQISTDVYPLPPPGPLVVASLGYRSALADVLMAHLLVSYGIHAQEHRRLEFAGEYLDAINELDPKFRDPYRYADTLLVIGPDEPPTRNYLKARAVFERGLQNLPYDSELWLTSGQFLVYLGGPHLPEVEQVREWKLTGAKMIAHACELASNNDRIPYQCIAAASLLNASGENEAAINSLRKTLAVTDDPEIERLALGYLSARLSVREKERQQRRREVFRAAWNADLPFVHKDMMLVVGPKTDLGRCAGFGAASSLSVGQNVADTADVACVTSWRAWAKLTDPAD